MALVTLLVIGFAVSMRVENAASKNFNDVIRARELANAAINQAVAQIREGTPVRTNIPPQFITYVTAPGMILTNYFNGGNLFIGDTNMCSAANLFDTNNMNLALWITGGTNGSGEFNVANPPAISAGWTYIPQNSAAAFGPGNPIIGRFSFWVDDEACKINVNTAGGNAINPDLPYASAQKEVDLQQLLPTPLATIFGPNIKSGGTTYPRGVYPYSTIEEIQRADALITADRFDDNRFSVTMYSDDGSYPNYAADLDVFGRNRLVLNPTNLNTTVNIEGPGDGAYARLADPALMQVCAAGALGVNSFEAKYGANGLKQIIANIIAYQLDPRDPADLAVLPDANINADPPDYLGLARVPYVNEVKVTYDMTGTIVPGIRRTVTIELFYPYGADGSEYLVGLKTDRIVVKNLPAVGPAGSTALLPANPAVFILPGGLRFNSSNPYYTFVYSTDDDTGYSAAGLVGVPAQTITVNYFGGAGTKRLDCARVPLPDTGVQSGRVTCHGAEVDDPCLNENPAEWAQQYRNVIDGSGGTLIATLPGQSAPGAPSQNNAYAPPAPYDTKMLIRGRTTLPLSVGELGYIHLPYTPINRHSWEHIRLQAQPTSEKTAGEIPDWAILDLFTVDPTIAAKSTAGRININSSINNLGKNGGPAPIAANRLVPLKALLSPVVPPGLLTLVASNIYSGVYVATTPPPADRFGSSTVYDTIGEVCEVQGMDNLGGTEAEKEALIRRIANLITVRSNAFNIWVIAQSIREPPGAIDQVFGRFQPTKDVITGEVRAQAVVERYEDTSTGVPVVKFRVRYFRYL